ncbi:hypothetical protein BVX97_00145 [bacterium E08(2017)]|nr:hypothetical protein BVX97_00145 [bacterium E08(2017)]
MKTRIRKVVHDKKGVAILIVIAMLATLMLAGSAFSISMRLERKGSANYQHSVVSRHLLWAALSQAVQTLDENIDGGGSFNVYPSWDVLPSIGDQIDGSYQMARVTTASSRSYIPGKLWPAVVSQTPNWDYVFDSDGVVNGRIAYSIVNVSGLLDGNMAGGTNRAFGATVSEIQPSEGLSWNDLCFDKRNRTHVRYESLREMKRLNTTLYEALGGYTNGFAHVFSCSKEGEYMDGGGLVEPKIYIGGDESDLQSRSTEIRAKLSDCGITTAGEQLFFMESLYDYIDQDCVPRVGTDAANTEAIVMCNEIWFYLDASGGGGTFTPNVGLEFIYPYITPQDNSFEYRTTLVVNWNQNGNAQPPINVSYPMGGGWKDTGYVANSTKAPWYNGNEQGTDPSDPNLTVPITSAVEIVDCTLTVEIRGDGQIVDRVTLSADPVTIPVGSVAEQSWECIDPRYNWDKAHAGGEERWMNVGASGSQDNPNNRSLQWIGYFPDVDDDIRWYCADSGQLRNIGELGNLPLHSDIAPADGRCNTISLFGDAPHVVANSKFFRYFTTSDAGYRRGLVNVNTTIPEVWAALFRDAPIGDPDPSNSNRISDGQARDIGNAIASFIESRGPFLDVSEFVNNSDSSHPFKHMKTTYLPGEKDVDIELILSSVEGMLTSRSNTFIILLAAEKYIPFAMSGTSTKGKSLSSAYAVATVCRDAYRTPDPSSGDYYHKMFIRSFNQLAQ